jgi:hypothetical protein
LAAAAAATHSALLGPGIFGAKLRSLSSRDFLAFLARFRQADRNGLLATLDLAAFAAAAAVRGAALIAMHFAFHVAACASRVSAFSLCHIILRQFLRSRESHCRRAEDRSAVAMSSHANDMEAIAGNSASRKTTKL